MRDWNKYKLILRNVWCKDSEPKSTWGLNWVNSVWEWQGKVWLQPQSVPPPLSIWACTNHFKHFGVALTPGRFKGGLDVTNASVYFQEFDKQQQQVCWEPWFHMMGSLNLNSESHFLFVVPGLKETDGDERSGAGSCRYLIIIFHNTSRLWCVHSSQLCRPNVLWCYFWCQSYVSAVTVQHVSGIFSVSGL